MESTSGGKRRRINALASEVARHQQFRKTANLRFNSRPPPLLLASLVVNVGGEVLWRKSKRCLDLAAPTPAAQLSSGHRFTRPSKRLFPPRPTFLHEIQFPSRAAGLLRRVPQDSSACSAASSRDPDVPQVPGSPVPARHASPGANRTCAQDMDTRLHVRPPGCAMHHHLNHFLRQRFPVNFTEHPWTA